MPGRHSGGRGCRHEGLLDRHGAERGTEIRNVAFQSRVASIGDRAGAHHADGVRSGGGGLGIIIRERLGFARARPRIAAGAVRVDLETRQALVDIGDEPRLAEFAVVDDVDAAFCLLAHDNIDSLRQPRLIGGGVNRFSVLHRLSHGEEIGGTWEAAGVGW